MYKPFVEAKIEGDGGPKTSLKEETKVKDNTYNCDRCDYKTCETSNISTHQKYCKNRNIECDQCEFTSNQIAVYWHKRKMHGNEKTFQVDRKLWSAEELKGLCWRMTSRGYEMVGDGPIAALDIVQNKLPNVTVGPRIDNKNHPDYRLWQNYLLLYYQYLKKEKEMSENNLDMTSEDEEVLDEVHEEKEINIESLKQEN